MYYGNVNNFLTKLFEKMKKKLMLIAFLATVNMCTYAQQKEPTQIKVMMGGKEYVLSPAPQVMKKSGPPKNVKPKPSVEKKDTTVVTSAVSTKKPETASSIHAQYAHGNVVVNGNVTGTVTVNIITNVGDTAPKVTIVRDSTISQKPAPAKPIYVCVRTQSYISFLDSRKKERIKPKEYVYQDYEPTQSFRLIKKRLQKALYSLNNAAGTSEFLLTEAGQNLLLLERGAHNIINVENAGIIDIYLDDIGRIIADFHSERYSGTDYTGKMRIFYRK